VEANTFDAEIRKYLPLLGNDEKKSLLRIIRNFLNISDSSKVSADQKPRLSSSMNYSKYHFPESSIKFDRGELNER
jgi:hypothetical protein